MSSDASPTLAPWSLQQVFDHVAEHLLSQRAKSLDDNGKCAYRGRAAVGELSCAIGCLIPKGAQGLREGLTVTSNEVLEPVLKAINRNPLEHVLAYYRSPDRGCHIQPGRPEPERLLDLLVELQDTHDALPVALWHSHLLRLAERHGLSNAKLVTP